MSQSNRPDSPERKAALNETLAQWYGRLSAAPAPDHLIDMVDQLELVRVQSSMLSRAAKP